MKELTPNKVLYVASTSAHLQHFHQPYIAALRREVEVHTMADGTGVAYPVAFEKKYFSLGNFRAMRRIRRILREERYDAVILNTTLAAFWVRMAMVGMKERPHVLNVVHGYLFHMDGGLKNRLLYTCERMLASRTDRIAVMNAEDHAIACKHRLCRGEVRFIRGMGYVMPRTLPARDETLRAEFAPLSDDFLCTFVGELSGRKNQAFLLSAAARLRKEGLPLHLLLVGEGGARAELEQTIRRNGWEDFIHLAGRKEDVLPYLAISDVYVSASRIEGLPFNLMEAMAAGLPIVASNVKGQQDLLAGHPHALYPLDDEDAFCEAVKEIYRTGRFGVGTVEYPRITDYSLPSVFEETLAVMRGGWKERVYKDEDSEGETL